jgi:hypothetical protein
LQTGKKGDRVFGAYGWGGLKIREKRLILGKPATMKFLSLSPFVPSGNKYEESKQLFQELGFTLNWEQADLAGFGRDGCNFILQRFERREFAENFMLSVRISDAREFHDMVLGKKLAERFGIRVGNISQQPYGKEVNIIDIAGVCWHFIE